MTLITLVVHPPRLIAASSALSTAAESIPTELPSFSVAGSDALSTAVSRGAEDVEAPMLSLPGIKTRAVATAHNVGVAAQRYAATDHAFAAEVGRLPSGEPAVGPILTAPKGITPAATFLVDGG